MRRALCYGLAVLTACTIGATTAIPDTPPKPTPHALYLSGYAAGEHHTEGAGPTDCGTFAATPFQEGYCDGYTDSLRGS